MRIAIFTDNFFPELGGIQDSIAATARELGARGHAVAIFAPTAVRRDFERANLPRAELDLGENVRIHRQFSVAIPGSTGQSRLIVPMPTHARAVAAFGPHVIHAHTFLGAGMEALAAARRLDLPLIGTNHWAVSGFGLYAPPVAREACARAAWRAVARFYNNCSWVSAPSLVTLAEMRVYGLRRPGSVVSNPIDTGLFRPPSPGERERLKQLWDLPSPSILYAGRLAREKCVEVLIRALPALRRDIPGATLVLAGHGTAEPELRALAQAEGLAGAVRFTGTLSQPRLAELCRAVDAFAIASTSESQSMMLLQAMSAGLPAVAARHGPLPELFSGGAGLLAQPDDPADFAKQLVRLLADRDLRERTAAHARRSSAGFGVCTTTTVWQTIYQRAIRGAWCPAPVRAVSSESCA